MPPPPPHQQPPLPAPLPCTMHRERLWRPPCACDIGGCASSVSVALWPRFCTPLGITVLLLALSSGIPQIDLRTGVFLPNGFPCVPMESPAPPPAVTHQPSAVDGQPTTSRWWFVAALSGGLRINGSLGTPAPPLFGAAVSCRGTTQQRHNRGAVERSGRAPVPRRMAPLRTGFPG